MTQNGDHEMDDIAKIHSAIDDIREVEALLIDVVDDLNTAELEIGDKDSDTIGYKHDFTKIAENLRECKERIECALSKFELDKALEQASTNDGK